MLDVYVTGLRMTGAVRTVSEEVVHALSTLPQEDLRSRLVGVEVVQDERRIYIYRGDYSYLSAPFGWFTARCEVHGVATAEGSQPDFSNVKVIDFGSAVRLGSHFEVSAESLFTCFDSSIRCIWSEPFCKV